MPNYVVAHDLGTTGNKATLYDREGRLVGASFQAYETEYAHTGWAEQNPQDWWDAVCQSTRHLFERNWRQQKRHRLHHLQRTDDGRGSA